jgi:predicted PolB exonuclease-like 3'-5' exonuclease
MLKREIPKRIWFFDMEWVPDAEAARRLFDLSDDTSELEAIEYLWNAYGATETKPRPFLKYLLSRVVSIAFLSRLVNGSDEPSFSIRSYPQMPHDGADVVEAEIIRGFLDHVGKRKPQLVGYNSFESDAQVLIQRGLINEISAPLFCKRPKKKWDGDDYFDRWDNEHHLDLLKLFSDRRGMSPGLNELARLCGLPGKMGANGDQVTDLWLQRDIESIVRYNQIDVLNTYLVWLRVVYFCGKLSADQYRREQQLFRSFLESEATDPEKTHIKLFLEKWEISGKISV